MATRKIRKDRTICSTLPVKEYEKLKNKMKMREWRASNIETCRSRERDRNQEYKKATFDAYGGRRCNWCGEDNINALALDHVNNDGAKWRKIHGMGKALYQWLKARHWPSEPALQVICYNCNQSKRINHGVLPMSIKMDCYF